MTRETKIGLVVATSFLLLVGVVVSARLWQGSTPVGRYTDDIILKTQATAKAKTSLAETKPQPSTLNADIKQVASQMTGKESEHDRIMRQLREQVNTPEVAPEPVDPYGIALPEPLLAAASDAAPPSPPAPKAKDRETPAPQPTERPVNPPPMEPLGLDDLPPLVDPPAPKLPAPNPASPPRSPIKPMPSDTISLPPPLQAGDVSLPPPASALPAPKVDKPAVNPLPVPGGNAPPAPVNPLPQPNVPLPAPPPGSSNPTASKPIPLPMNPEVRSPEGVPPPVTPGTVSLPPVKPMVDEAPPPVIRPLPPVKQDEAPPVVNINVPAPIAQPLVKPAPVTPPPITPTANPSVPPPVGFQPQTTSPPIRVPMPPQVLTYDVAEYRVQPGDTSFADVSKKRYQSESYGRALLAFNRDYPLASELFRLDPPRLTPGQVVYVPQLDVLVSKYGNLVNDPGPRPQPPAPLVSNDQGVRAGPPQPVPATNNPDAAKLGGRPFVAPDGAKHYLVGGNGEMLFEIARRYLGDGRRWSEIYRLNPDLRPEYPIPPGRDLKLPAEAQVQ